jgi:diguanylate cyclase (GGDEF)-like protein/PAS domain S-box-containing protein
MGIPVMTFFHIHFSMSVFPSAAPCAAAADPSRFRCGRVPIRPLWLLLLFLLASLFSGSLLAADQSVRLGVLAFRPKPETLTRWQPTAEFLAARTGRDFQVQAYTYAELEAAISQHRVDFVLTNPAHYVLMTRRNNLSSPLATLIELEAGQPLSRFGGVIFTRSNRNDITQLQDLKGKTIATPDIGSFGGYQMQAFELNEAGIRASSDINLLVTDMPHDTALAAVLEGRADAGFIRTGVIESLIGSGRLKGDRIKVVNRQLVPGFPFLHSTRLYPEWPIAAMPGTDEQLAQQVATALFSLPAQHPAARTGHYHGWAIPTDYEPVRALLQGLRLPPFDHAPEFTWQDIVAKHGLAIALTGLIGTAIILLLAVSTVRQKQLRLQESRIAEERQQLLAALGEGVIGVDLEGRCIFINPAALAMLDFTREELLGVPLHPMIHHHDVDGAPYAEAHCPINLTVADGVQRHHEEWLFRKDGSRFPVELTAGPIERNGVRIGAVVAFHDISQRLASQARDQLLISALEAVPNGIVITNPQAEIEWVNPAFESLTGYTRQDAIGRRPAELVKSGLHDQTFYESMWRTILAGQTWRGEVVNKKRDGTLYHEELIIAPVQAESGEILHFVGVKQDISVRKELEASLQNLATTDPLTGLPNRRHFLAQMEQEVARLSRFTEIQAALLMLDLDHFKLINDTHGHAAGDAVLRHFAERLRNSLRQTDVAGRLGGEEFAILLIGSDSRQAVEMAERLRVRVAEDNTDFGGVTIQVTVSIGVTQLLADDGNADAALARADIALYQAKARGRNRVEMNMDASS